MLVAQFSARKQNDTEGIKTAMKTNIKVDKKYLSSKWMKVECVTTENIRNFFTSDPILKGTTIDDIFLLTCKIRHHASSYM